MKFNKYFWLSILVISLTLPFVVQSEVSCDININGKSDAELEIALAKCEEEIAEQEALLDEKQRESVTIERDIDILGSKINKTQADIKAKEIQIYKLKNDINSKKETISGLNNRSERTLVAISNLIKKTNELDSFSTVEAVLSQEDISEFFIDYDDFGVLKGDLKNNLVAIREIKEETMTAQQILEEKEQAERALKIAKEEEKRKTENYKKENEVLLSVNREQESEYKKTIAEKEKIKNEIKNRIFKTVGGTELRFEDALRLVQPYESRIGVESALVLAVLTQESAIDGVIGSNLGRCTYNQSASNTAGTVMSNSQKESFLAIMKELGMNPNTTPVSCPIYGDGNYGGAMGPSQFMPNTWYDVNSGYGYKKRVANILNVETPSPFNNLDAFVGTASYLSDARERCDASIVGSSKGFSTQFDIWSCSAAKYYAGLGASGSRLMKHMTSQWSYGYRVAERAQSFQKDIDMLDL
ncbi:hypothetical protein KKC45_00175 [Patescibacteria group bacterium]|nr:hypothetical protein [Patescibacteria group bacterium]